MLGASDNVEIPRMAAILAGDYGDTCEAARWFRRSPTEVRTLRARNALKLRSPFANRKPIMFARYQRTGIVPRIEPVSLPKMEPGITNRWRARRQRGKNRAERRAER